MRSTVIRFFIFHFSLLSPQRVLQNPHARHRESKLSLCTCLIGFFILSGAKPLGAQTNTEKYAVWAEVSHCHAGVGLQYGLSGRLFLPLSVGISNAFNEKKWNDWYVGVQPYYLLGHRKVQFPVGVLGGIRLMNDYGNHFTVFYGGVYGGVLYHLGRHGIGVNVGVKYGKKNHLLSHTETWGRIEAYETYREQMLYFSVKYSLLLKSIF